MKKINKILILVFIISFISVSSISFVLARYIKLKKENLGITSDKFYFTVNILGDTNTDESLSKEYHLYGGDSKEIGFTIQNYYDELRYTKTDITFTTEIIKGNDIATININKENKLIGGNCNSLSSSLLISEGYDDGKIVKVKIESTKPYIKTMYLSFILHNYVSDFEVNLNDSVGSLYLEVVLNSNVDVKAKSIIIDYSSINIDSDILQADLTNNYLLDDNNELNTNKLNDGQTFLKKVIITKDVNAGEAISLYFFKTKPSENYKNILVSIIKTVNEDEVIYTVKLVKEGGN